MSSALQALNDGVLPRIRNGRVEDRFWSKVDKRPDGCWLWTATLVGRGYGGFQLNGKSERAHRLTYMWLVGPIPEGLELDHLCRNRACCNPDHLEAVTRQVNTIRGHEWRRENGIKIVKPGLRKTHCKRGHEFTDENTSLTKEGYKHCRECIRQSRRKEAA